MIFTLKWLYPYWKGHKYRMLVIVVLGMFSAALHTVEPLLIKNIVNGLSLNLNPEYILRNVFLIIGAGIGIYVVNLAAQRNRAWMNMHLEWEFRKAVFEHIIYLDRNFYYKYTTGDIVTRLVDDISNKISWFSCSGVFRFIQSIFTIIAVLSVMIYLNAWLTFWVLIPMPFILVFSVKIGKLLSRRYNALQETISNIYDFLVTCFTGIRVIKANAKEIPQTEFFAVKTEEQRKAEIATARLDVVFSYFYHYAGFVSVAFLYAIGGKQVIDGKIMLGELIAFQFYSSMVIWPLMDISNFFVSGSRAGASIKRINELEKNQSEIKLPDSAGKIDSIKKLEFQHISLQTRKDNEFILKDISFKAQSPQRIAMVGKIGSGKSTVLGLVLRLGEFTHGHISVNSEDIRKIEINSLRSLMGYVSQEPFIFSESILNNITMGRKDIAAEKLDRAVEVSQLKQDLNKFPKGLDTFVGTRGFAISGGQKQRIAIARALAICPDVLILDDATSAMDAQTEENFWNDFKKHFPQALCLLVTHRVRTIENSDYILTFDGGKLVEQGKHAELMALNGTYKQIYERQKLQEEITQHGN